MDTAPNVELGLLKLVAVLGAQFLYLKYLVDVERGATI